MTKQDLIEKLAESTGNTKRASAAFLDTLGDIATASLKAGGEVTLPGLGKLVTTKRDARPGRNLRTGEEVTISARIAPKFKAAKALKDALN